MKRLLLLFLPFSLLAGPAGITSRNLTPIVFAIPLSLGSGTTNKTYDIYAVSTNDAALTYSATGLPGNTTLTTTTLTSPVIGRTARLFNGTPINVGRLVMSSIGTNAIGSNLTGINITVSDGIAPSLNASMSVSFHAPVSYYVATNGSDANPGTVGSPFLTLSKAKNSVLPGDTVFVGIGTYNERVNTISTTNGSDYITWTNNSAGSVECRGFSILQDYVWVQGFTITNDTVAGTSGFWIDGNYSKIVSNYIYNCGQQGGPESAGIGGLGSDPSGRVAWPDHPWGAYIALNHTYKCQENQPVLFGATITSNNFERCYQWTSEDADYSRLFGEQNVYSYNWCHGSVSNDVSFSGSFAHVDCMQSFDNTSGSGNFQYYLADSEFTRNFWFDADEAVQLEGYYLSKVTNNIFHHNLFANGIARPGLPKGGSAINIHAAPYTVVTNNTFYRWQYGLNWSTNAPAGFENYKATNGIIKNNIFSSQDQAYFYDAPVKPNADYNWDDVSSTNSYPVGPHDKFTSGGLTPSFANVNSPFGVDGIMWTADDGFHVGAALALTSSETGGEVGAYAAIPIIPPPTVAGFRATKIRR